MTNTTNNNRRKLDLLNFELPERDTDHIRSILTANNMPFHIPDTGGYAFNCWGFVALNFGWEVRPRWVDGRVMESYLESHTVPIDASEAMVGDIAVFRSGYENRLTHTALVTHDLGIICHKPGSGDLCVDTLDNARRSYGDVTYARPKDSKLIEEKVEKSVDFVTEIG